MSGPRLSHPPIEQPEWCRLDVCDEVTRGREVDHHTGPAWQMVPAHWPEIRANLAAVRHDHRARANDPVNIGDIRIELQLDQQVMMGSSPGRGWMWSPTADGRLEVTTEEARALGHRLIALADTADAAVSRPRLLRVDD